MSVHVFLVAKDWAVVAAFCAPAMKLPIKLHVEIRETLQSKLEPVLKDPDDMIPIVVFIQAVLCSESSVGTVKQFKLAYSVPVVALQCDASSASALGADDYLAGPTPDEELSCEALAAMILKWKRPRPPTTKGGSRAKAVKQEITSARGSRSSASDNGNDIRAFRCSTSDSGSGSASIVMQSSRSSRGGSDSGGGSRNGSGGGGGGSNGRGEGGGGSGSNSVSGSGSGNWVKGLIRMLSGSSPGSTGSSSTGSSSTGGPTWEAATAAADQVLNRTLSSTGKLLTGTGAAGSGQIPAAPCTKSPTGCLVELPGSWNPQASGNSAASLGRQFSLPQPHQVASCPSSPASSALSLPLAPVSRPRLDNQPCKSSLRVRQPMSPTAATPLAQPDGIHSPVVSPRKVSFDFPGGASSSAVSPHGFTPLSTIPSSVHLGAAARPSGGAAPDMGQGGQIQNSLTFGPPHLQPPLQPLLPNFPPGLLPLVAKPSALAALTAVPCEAGAVPAPAGEAVSVTRLVHPPSGCSDLVTMQQELQRLELLIGEWRREAQEAGAGAV